MTTMKKIGAIALIIAAFVLMAYMDTDSALHQHLPRP